jgi:hypothetical protein
MHPSFDPSFDSSSGPPLPDEKASASRRRFLLLGVGALLTGCASTPQQTASLPPPVWRPYEPPKPLPLPAPPAGPSLPAGVIARSQWTTAGPDRNGLNKMLPIRYITFHHDGMDPFWSAENGSARARLERIRMAHRGKGWADIGYHFAVDRAGRVWEARSLNWQGAHVKDRNEGNIGIVALGNFDRQAPTSAQVQAVCRHVSVLMHQYKVPKNRVLTHKEWQGAATACPGTNLQRMFASARSNGIIA